MGRPQTNGRRDRELRARKGAEGLQESQCCLKQVPFTLTQRELPGPQANDQPSSEGQPSIKGPHPWESEETVYSLGQNK